ncbi:MAG: hypothetical protein M1816_001389 [Peltula sp. TS41687]|nr:MAG: hypothetical protein M1816_001389 [Peltula sp. TS41687]
MESLRRTFGIAEPVRRAMEIKIVAQGSWRPGCLGGAGAGTEEGGIGMDVLRGVGVDDGGVLGWEDVFRGDETVERESFHDEMERRLRMGW